MVFQDKSMLTADIRRADPVCSYDAAGVIAPQVLSKDVCKKIYTTFNHNRRYDLMNLKQIGASIQISNPPFGSQISLSFYPAYLLGVIYEPYKTTLETHNIKVIDEYSLKQVGLFNQSSKNENASTSASPPLSTKHAIKK